MAAAAAPNFSIRSYHAIGATHAHEHAQVVLPLLGAMDLAMTDRSGRVTGRSGVLIPARVPHQFAVRGPNRFVVLDFDCAASASFFAVDPTLTHLLAYLGDLAARTRIAPDVRRHATALLADAVRERVPVGPRLSAPLRRALELIEQRYATRLGVRDIADAAGLSPSHLHAEFRRQLDKTPARHLADVRLDAAIERLRGGDEPIAQIALACGYSEQSALGRALRRCRGTTPAALRRS